MPCVLYTTEWSAALTGEYAQIGQIYTIKTVQNIVAIFCACFFFLLVLCSAVGKFDTCPTLVEFIQSKLLKNVGSKLLQVCVCSCSDLYN